MYHSDYFFTLVELPTSVGGAVVPNSDGTYNIYINERHCDEKRLINIKHELEHIALDHLYDPRSVEEIENEVTHLIMNNTRA